MALLILSCAETYGTTVWQIFHEKEIKYITIYYTSKKIIKRIKEAGNTWWNIM